MVPLYDTHAHLFINATDLYPIDTRGAREGEEALRRRLASDPLPAARLFDQWDDAGVVAGCGVQYNTVYKTDNRFLLDTCDAHPERLSAVVILDATDPATPAALERMADRHGIVGLRLYGQPDGAGAYPWFDSPAAHECWRVCGERGLVMVLMYGPATPSPAALGRIAALAERFPRTRIALDHFGWATRDGAIPPELRALAAIGTIHFKLTTINLNMFDAAGIDPAAFVREAADIFGAGRMMWGSDVGNTLEPFGTMAARARAAAARLSPDEARLFLCDSGRRLFDRALRG